MLHGAGLGTKVNASTVTFVDELICQVHGRNA